jgi:uncharacterized protein (DUF2141 family)
MLKLLFPFSAAALALAASFAAPLSPALAALGPDAARCRNGSGQPAILVNVSGFKNRVGALRVQLYGGNPNDFLVRGKRLRRIDLPLTRNGTMEVCVAVPAPGTYAVAVRHDADGNGKTGWNDGGGFSNNPQLSIANLKPAYRRVSINVGNGVKPISVVLNYRTGFTIKPIGS